MVGLSWPLVILCLSIVFVGSVVQATIGIGLGMLASPVLALVDHDFIPAAIMIAVVPLSFTVAWADRRHIEGRHVGLAILGRLPGVVLGAWVVSIVSDETLALVVAGAVMLAVVASVVGRVFAPTPSAIVGAGIGSGFTGTATGIGGPPIALVYQHADPSAMRATISAFFAIGAVMSIVALAVAGEIGHRQLELTAFLLPPVLLGTWVARRVKDRLNPAVVRPTLLAACVISCVVLLAETL